MKNKLAILEIVLDNNRYYVRIYNKKEVDLVGLGQFILDTQSITTSENYTEDNLLDFCVQLENMGYKFK